VLYHYGPVPAGERRVSRASAVHDPAALLPAFRHQIGPWCRTAGISQSGGSL